VKRRILLGIVTFAIAIIGFSAPTHVAHAACVTASGTANGLLWGSTFNVEAGDIITGTITSTVPGSAVATQIRLNGVAFFPGWTTTKATVTMTATSAGTANVDFNTSGGVLYNWTMTIGRAGCNTGTTWFEPGDDRLNREAGAPAVLYCRNKGDVHVYTVDTITSRGKIDLVVTRAEVDAVVNSNPTANTLIKQSADGSVKVFYLPATKELSLISKDSRPPYKPYSFVWKGCA
jgi:hypothetical protein